ncbi:MAG: monovalent cation/H+ antiporter subunit D family protein [Deltaproteobacteria bacterium]|nr:monovalent cation/H+ antiporter subunit D family protein [Deltaproteobacteria bacterium]
MNDHYPALLIISPLLFAFLVSGMAWIRKGLCYPLALVGSGLCTWFSVRLLADVLQKGVVQYRLGGWETPWGIGYHVDTLNGMVLAVVSVLAFINLVATRRSVSAEFPEKEGAFYTLYLLFIVGLVGMVVTGDLFNLYVLLEVASLTSYALIALGGPRAPLASLNYLFMGTIGGCFYLLGVGYLYIMTGSLNMADVASLLPGIYSSTAIWAAFTFCMVGIGIKMAFFPLHGWLPNAYTFAPSSVSSLMAPLMTKVMVYVMIRLMLSVFTIDFTFSVLSLGTAMVWLSILAIVTGALLALAQKNLKRMFCYIIVSEIGYMVGGAWLGNAAGMTGAILHILNDALMTICLFLTAANVHYRISGLELHQLRGLFHRMPLTMACFVAAGLSIIGVPPTCGFFSKWYLITGALQAGQYGFVAALLFSSLVNVILFFRVIEISYYGDMQHPHGHGSPAGPRTEAPATMLAPLLIVSAGLVIIGVYTGTIVTTVIDPIIPATLVR